MAQRGACHFCGASRRFRRTKNELHENENRSESWLAELLRPTRRNYKLQITRWRVIYNFPPARFDIPALTASLSARVDIRSGATRTIKKLRVQLSPRTTLGIAIPEAALPSLESRLPWPIDPGVTARPANFAERRRM